MNLSNLPIEVFVIVAIRHDVQVPMWNCGAFISKSEAEKFITGLQDDHPDYRDDGCKYVLQSITIWTRLEERDQYYRRESEVLAG